MASISTLGFMLYYGVGSAVSIRVSNFSGGEILQESDGQLWQEPICWDYWPSRFPCSFVGTGAYRVVIYFVRGGGELGSRVDGYSGILPVWR